MRELPADFVAKMNEIHKICNFFQIDIDGIKLGDEDDFKDFMESISKIDDDEKFRRTVKRLGGEIYDLYNERYNEFYPTFAPTMEKVEALDGLCKEKNIKFNVLSWKRFLKEDVKNLDIDGLEKHASEITMLYRKMTRDTSMAKEKLDALKFIVDKLIEIRDKEINQYLYIAKQSYSSEGTKLAIEEFVNTLNNTKQCYLDIKDSILQSEKLLEESISMADDELFNKYVNSTYEYCKGTASSLLNDAIYSIIKNKDFKEEYGDIIFNNLKLLGISDEEILNTKTSVEREVAAKNSSESSSSGCMIIIGILTTSAIALGALISCSM